MKLNLLSKRFFQIGLILTVMLLIVSCNRPSNYDFREKITPHELELRLGMRKLWGDHALWTRLYIISVLANAPDADVTATAQRLLKNQEDIGNAIKPYYGNEAGNQLTILLKEHITIAVDIIDAAKNRNSAAQEVAEEKWKDNADRIAIFLAHANPSWNEQEMKDMLQDHLTLTKQEVVGRLNKDYDGDIENYDQIHAQILEMADEFSTGIVNQFPEQFGRGNFKRYKERLGINLTEVYSS